MPLPPVYSQWLGGGNGLGPGAVENIINLSSSDRWIAHYIQVRLVNNDYQIIGGCHVQTPHGHELDFTCTPNKVQPFTLAHRLMIDPGEEWIITVEGGLFTATINFYGQSLSLP